MKKHWTILLMTLLASAMFFYMEAKNDDPEGEPIPIEFNDPGESGNPILRGPVVIPFEVYLDNTLSQVNVLFLANIGEVSVQLKNLTTGLISNTMIDSTYGEGVVPITGGAGSYYIVFWTEDGAQYSGFFFVQ